MSRTSLSSALALVAVMVMALAGCAQMPGPQGPTGDSSFSSQGVAGNGNQRGLAGGEGSTVLESVVSRPSNDF
jgi:hypothetical protein